MQQEDLNSTNELVEYNEIVSEENKKKRRLKRIQYIFWYISIVLIILTIHVSYKTYKENKDTKDADDEEIVYQEEAVNFNNQFSDYIQETIRKNENVKQEDRKYTYNNPYIPEGFDHIDGSWNEGLIIVDENGNQFVWVPCTLTGVDGTVKLDRYDFCVNTTLKTKDCMEKSEDIKAFIDSVEKYQGFWIARYESGNDKGQVISKADVNVWNYISQADAIDVSKKLYENKDKVHSSLVNSYAWDTTLQWLDELNHNFSISSIGKGYHGKKLRTTGNYSVNNIHDMAGNAWEWTTETSYDEGVYRAGYTTMDYTTVGEPGFRGLINNDTGYYLIGFRVIMYAE